jgi:hypothetical protein
MIPNTPAPATPAPPTTLYQVGELGELLIPEPAYPSISEWLSHCASMATHSNKGIDSTSLAHMFATNGFHSLDQIDGMLITAMQLHKWLHVDLGTGIHILQFAKTDQEAINAGTLHFDSVSASGGTMETPNMAYAPEIMTQNENY